MRNLMHNAIDTNETIDTHSTAELTDTATPQKMFMRTLRRYSHRQNISISENLRKYIFHGSTTYLPIIKKKNQENVQLEIEKIRI